MLWPFFKTLNHTFVLMMTFIALRSIYLVELQSHLQTRVRLGLVLGTVFIFDFDSIFLVLSILPPLYFALNKLQFKKERFANYLIVILPLIFFTISIFMSDYLLNLRGYDVYGTINELFLNWVSQGEQRLISLTEWLALLFMIVYVFLYHRKRFPWMLALSMFIMIVCLNSIAMLGVQIGNMAKYFTYIMLLTSMLGPPKEKSIVSRACYLIIWALLFVQSI
jgi:hypothetical protein